jgi:biopolymer transport protein ExbD
MAMSVGNAGGGVMCDINTTPLIDVMLVLLVTLIVSLPIMTHAVKLDMPQTNTPPPPDQRPEVIDLEIDFDGTVACSPCNSSNPISTTPPTSQCRRKSTCVPTGA